MKEITYNGETKTIKRWARGLGITPDALLKRIRRGWPIRRALTIGKNSKFTVRRR